MRLTSKTPNFPWKDRNISYIFVDKKLNAFQVGGNRDISHDVAYKKANSGLGKLIAVWPGNYRSDAFLVDKLDDYGAAFGLAVMKDLPAKLVGYERKPEYDLKTSRYVRFYLETQEENFSLSDTFVTQFSMMIEKKFGWHVCTSKGYSGGWSRDGRVEVGLYVIPKKNPLEDSWGTCFSMR